MSALLDLQDDLAEVVVWLAENWSADLPVPHAYGGVGPLRDEPGAELFVYCATAEELARVAARLGAPIRRTQGHTPGVELGKAIRDFGRVRIKAYTLPPEPEAGP
jgi:hypothetical protein